MILTFSLWPSWQHRGSLPSGSLYVLPFSSLVTLGLVHLPPPPPARSSSCKREGFLGKRLLVTE